MVERRPTKLTPEEELSRLREQLRKNRKRQSGAYDDPGGATPLSRDKVLEDMKTHRPRKTPGFPERSTGGLLRTGIPELYWKKKARKEKKH